jgi:hypothetical protein
MIGVLSPTKSEQGEIPSCENSPGGTERINSFKGAMAGQKEGSIFHRGGGGEHSFLKGKDLRAGITDISLDNNTFVVVPETADILGLA